MSQEIAAHLETLKATPARLQALLKGVPRALALWRPAPGKWSILEIACHLRDMEKDAYQARYRRILAEDNPTLPDVDGDRIALERDYRSQKLADVMRDWKRLRKENLALLRKVKGAAWQRPGVHETAGPLTMEVLLRRHAVGNDEAHASQIEAIKYRHELLTDLEKGPVLVRAALKALSDADLRRRTPEGKWSPLEHACHLRDIETVFTERISKAAFADRPSFWMADNDALAAGLRYAESDPGAVAKEFAQRRAETLTLLRALPHAAWQRTGRHPHRGEVSILQLAQILAGHDRSHVERMKAA